MSLLTFGKYASKCEKSFIKFKKKKHLTSPKFEPPTKIFLANMLTITPQKKFQKFAFFFYLKTFFKCIHSIRSLHPFLQGAVLSRRAYEKSISNGYFRV